jgi:hypothetical protein
MRHLTAIIAALMYLSFTPEGVLAGDRDKKIDLTDHEMDAVTAAGPAEAQGQLSSILSNLSEILEVRLFSRIRTSQVAVNLTDNSLEINFSNGTQTTTTNTTQLIFVPPTRGDNQGGSVPSSFVVKTGWPSAIDVKNNTPIATIPIGLFPK